MGQPSPMDGWGLQQWGLRNARRQINRAIVRFVVLVAADVGVFLGLVALVTVGLEGRTIMSEFATALESVGGWELGAALFFGLLVAGSYGSNGARSSVWRLLIGSAITIALIGWRSEWSLQAGASLLPFALGSTVLWGGLILERWGALRMLQALGFPQVRLGRTVVVGPVDERDDVLKTAPFRWESGDCIVGFVDASRAGAGDALGDIVELPLLLMAHRAESVVVSADLDDRDFRHVAVSAQKAGCRMVSVPSGVRDPGLVPQLIWRQGRPFFQSTSPSVAALRLSFKRLVDMVGAAVGLVLLAPVFAIVAVAIKVDSPGPVFFRSERWGRFGRKITINKFRTMVLDAEELLYGDAMLKNEYHANIKLADDPRVTRMGRWLRRWSMDELPQFYDVLLGKLSFVGPRPKLIDEEPKYGAAWETVLSVRPGLTGLWQISGRNDTTYEERIRLDVRYATHRSFWWDLSILIRTIPTVFRGHGAY